MKHYDQNEIGAILNKAAENSVTDGDARGTGLSLMLRTLALITLALLALTQAPVSAQNALTARVLDAHEREPLQGVNVIVEGTSIGGATDANGMVTVSMIPDGPQVIVVSYIGFTPHRLELVFPLAESSVEVLLEEHEEEFGEAVVTATRTSRTIADTPTRVETIGGEEIAEKIAMDPSGISMILNESPGIVVQQTSAVSSSASFRIQGLDGRYTQLLRDGFPLYGGLGGGLSLLQIPPLDLEQVEVIKGPSSTLYGADAIAGLVNLVSKKPTLQGERSLLVNGTTARGVDAAVYLAKRSDTRGYTLLASGNLQRAYDAESDDFTNLPATQRLNVAPTFYHYGAGALVLRVSGTIEEREGGDIDAIRDGTPGFTERNASNRLTAAIGYDRPIESGHLDDLRLTVRSSGSLFSRAVQVPGFRLDGQQIGSYTEASVRGRARSHEVVLGADFKSDQFEQEDGGVPPLDYAYRSSGLFAQDTWDVSATVALESGLRVDVHNEFGTAVLPHIALLVRPTSRLTARVGGGLGYSAPTPFLEEAEARSYQGVGPIPSGLSAERSVGWNIDLNYRAVAGPIAITLNQAVYSTELNDALVPSEAGGSLSFVNGAGTVRARGSETTARLSRGDLALFLGYVYLEVDRESGGETTPVPYTARHRTYTVLVWEQHGKGRIGLEAYYTGPQTLSGGEESPGYLITGIMAQRRLGDVTLFANLENMLDARQSRTSPLVTGPRDSPSFPGVWGPTDGFIANAGFILEF